ncbi:hypothetical protein ACF0H5_014017 [Mactra antiquata]
MANMWHSLALILLTVCCSLVSCGNITISLNQGVCLCVNEPNTKAVSDPANPSTTISQLRNGDCFTSNGGLYHSGDVTWYELKDDRNGLTAWVDSFYLEIVSTTKCSSAHASGQSHHTPDGSPLHCEAYGHAYTHGQVFTLHGMSCICDDGALLCSFTGTNCYENGIVYSHGSSFDITGRGTCSCNQGNVQCLVGK